MNGMVSGRGMSYNLGWYLLPLLSLAVLSFWAGMISALAAETPLLPVSNVLLAGQSCREALEVLFAHVFSHDIRPDSNVFLGYCVTGLGVLSGCFVAFWAGLYHNCAGYRDCYMITFRPDGKAVMQPL